MRRQDQLPPALDEYLPGLYPPLEAQIIDLCDEIAYNTADLDDGCESELLDVESIVEECPAVAEQYWEADRKWPGVASKLKFNEAVKGLLDALAS